ncbi:Glutamyl-Q tRNA(Asp) synthetase, partial [hydrothermal vent metagenome]
MSNTPEFSDLLKKEREGIGAGVIGRYAPSPTGHLHWGNIFAALMAWLQCRLAGGRFFLRMEDLDQPRVRPGSVDSILQDLLWLGLNWDASGEENRGMVSQSRRRIIYDAALTYLDNQQKIFPCGCSRKDIALAVSAPHAESRKALIYPGTCRDLPRNTTIKQSTWRYRVPESNIEFTDELLGMHRQSLHQDVGDFVLRRADGVYAYQLVVVVDDLLMGVTDVVRGADLLDSTPRQIELFNKLGGVTPRFWHTPLLCDDQGVRLSKRNEA